MKKYKNKILAGVIILTVLAAAFIWGGRAPSSDGVSMATPGPTPVQTIAPSPVITLTPTETVMPTPAPTATPKPEPTATATAEPANLQCTLSVRCNTILKNLSLMDPEKTELVPKDGVIYPEKSVIFYEGESVFNLLAREMKQNKIHLEFVNTPLYNSAYIEGIGNLYDFDCGELSGWMYKVNGVFPGYGCSQHLLEPGDRVEWVYTCDLGADVGDTSGTRNGYIKNE